MAWCWNRYDPQGTPTFALFGNPQIQDSGGPHILFWRDVTNLILRFPLAFSILRPFYTRRPIDELFLWNWAVLALIWFGFWSIVQTPFLLAVIAGFILVVAVLAAGAWLHSLLLWTILQGPGFQVFPRNPAQIANVHLSNAERQMLARQRWVYLNGVATGKTILRQNLKLLSQTFGRPVLGINNRTYGFLGDLIECVLQRSFGFRTLETRITVPILRQHLRDAAGVDRVILIAHSQGGILASHVLDDLYAELASDELNKLEVYTFGNAALHFNNPWETHQQLDHVIRHMEHYCNDRDMVCSWGALSSVDRADTLFRGSVFVSESTTGHLLNQHYLKPMFPVPPATAGPDDFLSRPAIPDPTMPDKYIVPSMPMLPPPGAQKVMQISRLHQYLNGRTPVP